jgi:hypothetical protein
MNHSTAKKRTKNKEKVGAGERAYLENAASVGDEP